MTKTGEQERWPPAEATVQIRAIARRADLQLVLTLHAEERTSERGLIMGDIMAVLRDGFVYSEPEAATRGHFKYKMEGTTPNSNGRDVRVIVIPGPPNCLKIVTVMWKDER